MGAYGGYYSDASTPSSQDSTTGVIPIQLSRHPLPSPPPLHLHPSSSQPSTPAKTNTTNTTTTTHRSPPWVPFTPPSPPSSSLSSSRPCPRLSTTSLTPTTLKLLLDTFDCGLSHGVRYAVCGRAALAVWGYRAPPHSSQPLGEKREGQGKFLPPHVTVICPKEDREVVVGWARAVGWVVYGRKGSEGAEGEGDIVIGVPVPVTEHGTEVYGVRVKTVEGWVWEEGRLEIVRPLEMEPPYVGWAGEMMRTKAVVLAVPTVMDYFARAWSEKVRRGMDAAEGQIAELLLWALRRLAADEERYGERARWRLTGENVPWVVDERFWELFVERYPEAMGLFQLCGLSGPVSPPDSEAGFTMDTSSIELDGNAAQQAYLNLLLDGFHPDSYLRREERGEGNFGSPNSVPTEVSLLGSQSTGVTISVAYEELERELSSFV